MRSLSARVIPVLCFAAIAAASPAIQAADSILVGEEFAYTVRPGDTLAGIGARFAVSPQSLASRNRLRMTKRLIPGRVLHVDNRHIVPKRLENGILINIPQRLLFYFLEGRLDAWYPVALGQPGSWQTPTGSYQVLRKDKDPVWEVPDSIQQEMRRKGEKVQTRVPPGPDNPLGEYRLGLSLTCCGIHGTNAPQSIYRFQTHGCIRLAPQDAVDLFSRVSVGAPVEIIYEPVLFSADEDGKFFVEIHPDVYRHTEGNWDTAKAIAESRGLASALKSARWEKILHDEEGTATRLPLRTGVWSEVAGVPEPEVPAPAYR
jgi:L,D-transpeptidase ErfK/SrfK